MGQHVSRMDFEWVYTEEPHATRRKEILKKHPEVRQLMGHDPRLKWYCLVLVLFQLVTAPYIAWYCSWPYQLFLAYALGGMINHMLTLAIHEISHNLAFGHKSPIVNRCFGIFTNLPLGIPYSVSFKKYHMLHHRYQGMEYVDMDIPSKLEAKLFANSFSKFCWLVLQPVFYVFRPVLLKPMPITTLESVNILCQVAFNLVYVKYVGLNTLIYLTGSTFLSLGLHPAAGHFISEHYMFKKGYETYSYYGWMNYLTFNVGYHNEHHDFPHIPGSKLPKLKELAPEYYDNLPCHNSWLRVLYDFIMDPEIGPYARVMRKPNIRPSEQRHDTDFFYATTTSEATSPPFITSFESSNVRHKAD